MTRESQEEKKGSFFFLFIKTRFPKCWETSRLDGPRLRESSLQGVVFFWKESSQGTGHVSTMIRYRAGKKKVVKQKEAGFIARARFLLGISAFSFFRRDFLWWFNNTYVSIRGDSVGRFLGILRTYRATTVGHLSSTTLQDWNYVYKTINVIVLVDRPAKK